MKVFFYIFFILLVVKINAQRVHPDSLYSAAVLKNYKKYKKYSNEAYKNRDYERADFLFDSLVKHVLVNKVFDNFKAKTLKGKTVSIKHSFNKPIFLLTFSSWMLKSKGKNILNKGEIPALNELAKNHSQYVDFVILFWDKKKNARKYSNEFNKYINVFYIDENENLFNSELANLKHTFGISSSFYIGADDKVKNIRKAIRKAKPTDEFVTAYTKNYNDYAEGLTAIVPEDRIVRKQLSGN